MNENNSDSKGCLIIGLIIFGLAAFKPLLALLFGDNVYEMKTYDPNTDSFINDVSHLRAASILLVITLIIYGYNRFKK